MNRIYGILIYIFSIGACIFGTLALVMTDDMAQLLSHAINEFNVSEWKQHWRLSSIILVVSGCIGIYAGIGIFKNQKFAFLLFSCLITIFLLGQALIFFSGYAIFAFEIIKPSQLILTSIFCTFSWYLYGRRMKKSRT